MEKSANGDTADTVIKGFRVDERQSALHIQRGFQSLKHETDPELFLPCTLVESEETVARRAGVL